MEINETEILSYQKVGSLTKGDIFGTIFMSFGDKNKEKQAIYEAKCVSECFLMVLKRKNFIRVE